MNHTNHSDKKSVKSEKSFYSTLLLSFLIISILLSTLLSLSLSTIFARTLVESTQEHTRQLLSQTNYAVDKMRDDADRLKSSLLSNNYIRAYLSTNTEDSTIPVMASKALSQQILVLPYVDSIYLYNAEMDVLYSSDYGYQMPLESHENQTVVSRLHDAAFIRGYRGEPVPNNSDSTAGSAETVSYYIFDDLDYEAGIGSAIVINVDLALLTDSISSMQNLSFETDSSFLLLDQDGTYVTSIINSDITDPDQWIADALKDCADDPAETSTFVRTGGMLYLLTDTSANTYGWHLVSFSPISVVLKDSVPLTLLCLLIMILVLVFAWFICRRFARKLNRPLESLASLVSGRQSKEHPSFQTKEFRMIVDTMTTLHDTNEQLQTLQRKSRYTLIQSTLNDLVSGHSTNPPEHLRQDLEYLGLSWIETRRMCMAVFKIDDYHKVLNEHTADEMWALRFSVVNIAEELASAAFTCSIFSHDDDKFILLIACPADVDPVAFEEDIVKLFHTICENISKYLHFTVTTAYSTTFQGINSLSTVYHNTEQSLYLKIRYGHASVIDPHQIDDIRTEPFHLSYRLSAQLIDRISADQADAAMETYTELTKGLVLCDHSEILSVLTHLVHSIYERLGEKYPILKDVLTQEMKMILDDLDHAEIRDDIRNLFRRFFDKICEQIRQLKEDPCQQNSSVIVSRITEIINENYPDPSLCLTSIAENIGLSPNYAGHIFKQTTQKSVAQFLLDVRMEKFAEYFKNTSLSVSDILEKVGLEKNNYFYTRFKNYFGMPLGEYRQKFRS